jgi:ornithine carbamoyltransferase
MLNSDVVFADKFIGIYDKTNKKKKIKDFKNFQVNSKLMNCAKKNAIFLHCLPASRGQEVSAEVIDGKQSKVWQQALNRVYVQKSVLLYCLEKLW